MGKFSNGALDPYIAILTAGLADELISKVSNDVMISGRGVYTCAVDPASNEVTMEYVPTIIIVDECDPLMGDELRVLLDAMDYESLKNRALLAMNTRGYSINHGSKRSTLTLKMAEALAAMEPTHWNLLAIEPPPVDPWYVKPLPKKNYVAPRQSFRTSMRSVNRNR